MPSTNKENKYFIYLWIIAFFCLISVLISLFVSFVFSDNSSLVNTFKVRKVFDRLDKNVSFVTGINNLFDLKTQEEAIRKGRPSIVVLNKGIDYSFDESISSILNATLENNGLILSEYPKDVEAVPSPFTSIFRVFISATLRVLFNISLKNGLQIV